MKTKKVNPLLMMAMIGIEQTRKCNLTSNDRTTHYQSKDEKVPPEKLKKNVANIIEESDRKDPISKSLP